MQRVLSFQMARGFSESSEFVTKRMCCSFLFSVGFLCLLCGFLLGRFAAERAMEFRAQRKRFQLAGNGLESTEYLQHLMLQDLEGASFDFETVPDLREDDTQRAARILSNLSFIHEVEEHESYITAIVRGSREADRYVVVSTSGQGVDIALELATILNKIQEEFYWRSRRTLVFCIFLGSSDVCPETLSVFIRRKVVAYISLQNHAANDSGQKFILSGSDIIQSVVLQAAAGIQDFDAYYEQFLSPRNFTFGVAVPRLSLDVPHAMLSFASENVTYHGKEYDERLWKLTVAQIFARSVWRLSECLMVKWEPKYFHESVREALNSMNNTKFSEAKENVYDGLNTLLNAVEELNEKIEATECTLYNECGLAYCIVISLCFRILETRMLNDILMELDRALLCNNSELQSRTDLAVLFKLYREAPQDVPGYLNEMGKCYKAAAQVLRDL